MARDGGRRVDGHGTTVRRRVRPPAPVARWSDDLRVQGHRRQRGRHRAARHPRLARRPCPPGQPSPDSHGQQREARLLTALLVERSVDGSETVADKDAVAAALAELVAPRGTSPGLDREQGAALPFGSARRRGTSDVEGQAAAIGQDHRVRRVGQCARQPPGIIDAQLIDDVGSARSTARRSQEAEACRLAKWSSRTGLIDADEHRNPPRECPQTTRSNTPAASWIAG